MSTNRKILIAVIVAVLIVLCCIGAACTRASSGSCDSMTSGTSITQTLEKPKPKPASKTKKSKKKHSSDDCD